MKVTKGQSILAGSDLTFTDARLMFNNSEFVIAAGKTVSFLSTEGGTGNSWLALVNKAHIKGGGTIYSAGINGTSDVHWFTDSTTFENIKLTGIIRGKENLTILGNVINRDTLQQAEHNYPVSIYFKKDFTNDGIVRDNPFDNDYLETVIEKNVINNNIWENSYVIMSGTSDQTFTNKGELKSSFKFKANVSGATSFQWYYNGKAIQGATSETYTANQNSQHIFDSYGEYYCETNSGNSRKITIENLAGGGNKGVILAENFDGTEFVPSGWTQKITNSNYTWKQGNPTDHPFTGIDATNINSALCPWVAENQNEWLKSPAVTLPNNTIKLEFYAGFSTDYLSNATLKLNISTDGGNNWTKVWEADSNSQGWKWRKIALDLSNYKNNSNVILAWQYVGNDGDLVGIDNVMLISGTTAVNESPANALPQNFTLKQNYPNPFNPATVISYTLPEQRMVNLSIYNILGEKVAELVNKLQNAGSYNINFNAARLATGTYIYRIQAGDFVQTRKMLLLK